MGKHIYDAVLTPEEEGGFSVEVPALPGCFTCGDSYREAVFMAADAMKTWIASAILHKEDLPGYRRENAPENGHVVSIFVETDETFIIDEPVVSAAQAARELQVSPGRITHLIDAGILEGYRKGRNTFVTEASIKARKKSRKAPGRPKKREILEA